MSWAIIDIGMYLLKILAVIGGVSAGGLGAGFLLRILVGRITHRKLPMPALRLVQLLGASALGWAVWTWAFGAGGSGFGLGGGIGGTGNEAGEPLAVAALTDPTTASTNAEAKTPPSTAVRIVHIEMLGGARVHDQRFYQVEGEPAPRTFAELCNTVLAQEHDAGAVKGIEIVIHQDSVSRDHPAVHDLEKWARAHGLTVSLSFPTEGAP
jgi:hypothetical protein